MTLPGFRTLAIVALSFTAGFLVNSHAVSAQSSHVYELRVYHTFPGRLPALEKRFREDTRRIFDRHGMTSVGYWAPQDAPLKDNEFIYILQHPSREAATKNWAEFRNDPEWQKVSTESEKDGKIVDKIESTFMTPEDFSGIK